MKKSELKTIIKDIIKEAYKQQDVPVYDGKKIIDFVNSDMAVNGVSKRVGISPSKLKRTTVKGKDAWIIKESVLREAKAPTSSLYGMIGRHLWPDFLKTVKSKAGKLKWVDNRAISMSIFMAQFDGYTRSDVSFDGYISMYVDKDEMNITITWNDASKGGNEKTWTVKHYEDYSIVATQIGKHLKQWQEI